MEVLAGNLARDQKRIWKSPLSIRTHDFYWLVPLAGVSAYLFASDSRNMTERFQSNAGARKKAEIVSGGDLAAIGAVPIYLSWYGWKYSDKYARDTASTSVRAATGAFVTAQILQLLTRREKPVNGSSGFLGSGPFNSSFPSMQSTVAWAIAPVIAERYGGWLTRLSVYGLASTISVSRLASRGAFPSDIAVGSAAGWLIGHYMATPRQHHVRAALPAPAPPVRTPPLKPSLPDSGSPYVPMDSWIYPALDRLAGLGLIPSQIAGLRPWTRLECLRQFQEAESSLRAGLTGASGRSAAVQPLMEDLRAALGDTTEVKGEIALESVYLRGGNLSGPALNDSYHFGQTWINDFGRPFGRGWNGNAGFAVRGHSGRFFAYYRGEYQHASSLPGYTLPLRELISDLDATPLQQERPAESVNRFRPIEAYVGVRVANLEVSVGKQSLYYGPTLDAPLSFSNNAEPTKNMKASMVHPYRLPGFLSYLGEMRIEFALGKLGGEKYTWRPWFNSQKLSFKLTENLEFGFTRWSMFWGVGHPITAGSFLNNFFSFSSTGTFVPYDRTDPGDRKAAFDFKYRIPGLRNWLTLYSDSYSDDDPSPLAAPRRAAISPGLHLTRVPGIPKLDIRAEASSTMPMSGDQGSLVYYNNQYRNANTNYGYLVGSPTGRDGRTIQGWATYWMSAKSKVEAGYRHRGIGALFLPGGGTQTDTTLRTSLRLSGELSANVFLQYEKFHIPSLAAQDSSSGGQQSNFSNWIALVWEPHAKFTYR